MTTVSAEYTLRLAVQDENGRAYLLPDNISEAAEYAASSTYYKGTVTSQDAFFNIPLVPVVTATLIILQSSEELTVKLNNDANIIFPAEKLFVLHSSTGITQLDAKNNSGSSATVRCYIFGGLS